MATPNPSRGDIVTFQLVKNGIIGDDRVDVKVDGLMQYSTARLIDPQLAIKHKNLYSYFKDKVQNVDDPSVYGYLALIGRNDKLEVIGIPWINDSTFQLIDGRNANIVCTNWREDFRAPLQTFMQSLGAAYTITVFDK
jgi:hypothetical protein